MKKDFDKWNEKKKLIQETDQSLFYHTREVWWCSLGVNVGYEQDGTGENFDRPVVVMQGFNQNTFFGSGLTGRKKEGKYYFYLGKIEGRDATAVLSQVKSIDTKRLIRKMGTLDKTLFLELQKSLKEILFASVKK